MANIGTMLRDEIARLSRRDTEAYWQRLLLAAQRPACGVIGETVFL